MFQLLKKFSVKFHLKPREFFYRLFNKIYCLTNFYPTFLDTLEVFTFLITKQRIFCPLFKRTTLQSSKALYRSNNELPYKIQKHCIDATINLILIL